MNPLRYIPLAPAKRTALLVIAVSPMLGCMDNLDPNLLDAKDLCTTYLKGAHDLTKPIGQIKISNMDDGDRQFDHDALYDFFVDAGALDRYDFRIDGGSINNNFFDAPGGKKRFGGSVDENDMACIEVFLKQDLTMDVSEMYSVAFYNPGLPADSSQAGNRPVKTVTPSIKILVRADDKYGDARTVPSILGSPMFADEYLAGLQGYAAGVPVNGSTTAQGSQIPELNTEIFAGGYGWTTYTMPPKAFDDFPCGVGVNAFTVCPSMANDLDEPNAVGYTFLVSIVDADIPLVDPTNFYTYSFVFDTDGNAVNDWVADPAFPNDFFQGTDRWYEVAYDPTTGWELIASQVTDGASRTVTRGIPTAANAMIIANTVTLVVPDSEIQDITKDFTEVGVRYTAFRHSGDFGLNPPYDYSADVEPKVGEPLVRID